jgi:hypothetical protein
MAFEMQDISYLLNPISNIFESSENTVQFCLFSAHRPLNFVNTDKLTHFNQMFENNHVFNQPLEHWNT